jgi:hypothetical protein
MQLEHARLAAERQKLMMEMEQSRQEHVFKMRELAEQHITKRAEHEMKRKEMAAATKNKATR